MQYIESSQKGGGHKLMQQFLALPEVQAAKLIFLDCSPLYQNDKEPIVMQRLHDFYAQYGFISKSNDGYSRLWLFQELPACFNNCFSNGYDEENDLHSVLMNVNTEKHIHLAY